MIVGEYKRELLETRLGKTNGFSRRWLVVVPTVTREKPFARELWRAIESSWGGYSVKSKGAGQLEITDLYKGVTRLDKEPDDYIVREIIPCNGGEEEEKEKSAGTGLQKIQSPVSPLSTPLDARIFYHSRSSCFTSFFSHYLWRGLMLGLYNFVLPFFRPYIYCVQWICGPLIGGCFFHCHNGMRQQESLHAIP